MIKRRMGRRSKIIVMIMVITIRCQASYSSRMFSTIISMTLLVVLLKLLQRKEASNRKSMINS